MVDRDTSSGFSVQVTIDCIDPHELAHWWAETLRWDVEPHDESFIRSMIEQGHATDDDTIVHRGALVWKNGAAINGRGSPGPGQPRMLFARVPEQKTVKNRVHLDLRTGIEDADALAQLRASLLERGASAIDEGREGPHTWTVMTDPEGNEFCI